jgi:serine-type D-Ala-D-Ala carboxypeptidase/endopeptidase (penicillin-binding protein 4)
MKGRGLAAATLVVALAGSSPAADFDVPLIWHVESRDGKVLDAHDSDKPVNPASVVKLATTLRALDTLGPDHRFVTMFGLTGEAATTPPASGVDLVVEGGADPDFHFENAVVVARALEDAGVSRVRGDLYVGPTFWIGWERGTVGREPDASKRREDMGRRLAEAWSPTAWNADQRKAWSELAARRHWDEKRPPSVAVDGRVRIDPAPRWKPVVVHRSEPLVVALRRFNVYSNNDIERLDPSIGSAADLRTFFEKRWGDDGEKTSFSTSSGLNANRMSPRLVVRLLHDLHDWLAAHHLQPRDVMPVLGCGESTLQELFRKLVANHEADGLVGKTGTLNLQDGGVSALAGFLDAGPGLVFFVAAPGAGDHLWRARSAEEEWVEQVLLRAGPVAPATCPKPVPTSEELAEISAPTRVSTR